MAAKFPFVKVFVKSEEKLNDAEGVRDAAFVAMNKVDKEGNPLTTSQDRKDLLIALNRETDQSKWLGVIRRFIAVVLSVPGEKEDDGEAALLRARKVAIITHAREVKNTKRHAMDVRYREKQKAKKKAANALVMEMAPPETAPEPTPENGSGLDED